MSDVKRILRKVRNSLPILRDWLYFRRIWGGYISFWKFLRFQLFPSFKNHIYFPYDPNSTVFGNILVGKCCKVTQRGGCYIQGIGKIFLGDYVQITQNCIITSSNHSLLNQGEEIPKEVIIGDHCWIASNSCIMAGVVLGPRTVVGAGSVVTKSFPEGYCLIAGNPAKFIKAIPKEEFVPLKEKIEFYGYIRADKFLSYKKKHLSNIKFHYDLSKVSQNEDLIRGQYII